MVAGERIISTVAAAPPRLNVRAAALAASVAVVWGSSYAVVKLGMLDLPVLFSLFLRILVSAAGLAVYARVARIRVAFEMPAGRLLLIHAAALTAAQVALYVGTAATTAGRTAVLMSTHPLFTLVLAAWLLPSEPFTRRKLAGAVVANVGVAITLADRLEAGSLYGDGVVLLGAMAWALASVLSKQLPEEVDPIAIMLWHAGVALPVTAILTLALESPPATITANAAVCIVYLGLVAGGFPFALFLGLIRQHSAIDVSIFIVLIPLVGVATGWMIFGEPLTGIGLTGAAVVAAELYLVTASRASQGAD